MGGVLCPMSLTRKFCRCNASVALAVVLALGGLNAVLQIHIGQDLWRSARGNVHERVGRPGEPALEHGRGIAESCKVRFFMHEPEVYEPQLRELSECSRKGADFAFVSRLSSHTCRVRQYAQADLAVIPCLHDTPLRCSSDQESEMPPREPSAFEKTALYALLQRSRAVWTKAGRAARFARAFLLGPPLRCWDLVAQSAPFRARNGSDHFWVAAYWDMQFDLVFHFQNITEVSLGKIEVMDDHEAAMSKQERNVNASRCAVIVPYPSDVAYHVNVSEPFEYEDWAARPWTLSYRFDPREYKLPPHYCRACFDATPLRRRSLELPAYMPPNSTSVHMARAPIREYMAELQSSKFCLVIRGDTPSTHGLFDALAAGCVPVLISDRFDQVAAPLAHGFHGHVRDGLNMSLFTVRVPEEAWMSDLQGVANRILGAAGDERASRALFAGVRAHRPYLLWAAPGPHASDAVLLKAAGCAAAPGSGAQLAALSAAREAAAGNLAALSALRATAGGG